MQTSRVLAARLQWTSLRCTSVLCPQQAVASFGTTKKQPRARKFKMKPKPSDPMLKDVLRQFYKKVHPDLFGRFPELRAKNEEALQTLTGVLEMAKSSNKEYVEPVNHDLEFFLRGDKPDEFLRVPISIRTTGNNCRHVLAEGLSTIFRHAGLPERFNWGTEYWEKKIEYKDSKKDEEKSEE